MCLLCLKAARGHACMAAADTLFWRSLGLASPVPSPRFGSNPPPHAPSEVLVDSILHHSFVHAPLATQLSAGKQPFFARRARARTSRAAVPAVDPPPQLCQHLPPLTIAIPAPSSSTRTTTKFTSPRRPRSPRRSVAAAVQALQQSAVVVDTPPPRPAAPGA